MVWNQARFDGTSNISRMRRQKLPDSHGHQLVFQLVERWHIIFLTWHNPLCVLTPEDTSAYNLYSKYFHNCLLSYIPDYFPIGIKTIFTMDLNGTSTRLFEPIGYDAIDGRIEKVCRGECSDQSSSLEGMIGSFCQVIGVWLVKVHEAADKSITPTTTPSDQQPDLTHVIGIIHPAMINDDNPNQGSSSGLPIQEENDYHLIDWFPDPVDPPIDFKNLLKDDIIKTLVTNYQNWEGGI
ncbi:hypothetical protein PSTG_08127 [Puccinia striiformis f. sp. tritici PST-78]|uniref:Uncharacterized protein n=1 Tax=Puccinia striiformis f. sp. tritici PST-78 TaxID=1165861 RepID=A0A0L0VH22_9BASI|nr:hypothetical protein PSTG_08127 [Puccinia striiformis f. sp. tritici PST-78]